MKGWFMAASAALVAAFVLGGGAVAAGAADAAPKEKEAAPALVKQVYEDSSGVWGAVADAEIGEDVSYRIAATLPERVFEHERVMCRAVDELPEGMELDLDSVHVSCGSRDLTGAFEVSLDGRVLTLEAPNLADVRLEGDVELDITYTARLTEASPVGKGGSVNAARLEVETDDESYVTPESRTAVLTYQLVITKVDAANHSRALTGARFVLGNKRGQYALVRNNVLVGWVDTQENATQLVSDTEGHVIVSGLDSDTYTLTEVSAPGGYQGLPEGVDFEIQSDVSFDIASGVGRIDSLGISSGSSASPGNTSRGAVYCMVENAQLPTQIVPTTGDATQDPWPFALLGTGVVGSALCARRRSKRATHRTKHVPAHMAAALLVAVACFFNHASCAPLRALALEPEGSAETLVIGLGNLGSSTTQTRSSAPTLRSGISDTADKIDSELEIPRSTTNSYINVLNMSYENAYVMVNDTENFACSTDSPTNTYINWSFDDDAYAGALGQEVSSMVLYRGTPGSHGAYTGIWGIDELHDTTGNGLVAIWFKDAGVLSDTGEPVSMLLKLTGFQIMPNYSDFYNYVSNGTCQEALSTYREYRNAGYSDVPLLYIFKSDGVDQTNPANARVWMNAIWCSVQEWSVSFYRSSEIPGGFSAGSGYSMGTLDLSDGLLVTTATNGETYLARQYCYDLDIAGVRWTDENGTYSSTSPYVTRGDERFANGGAYLTEGGAESFTWSSGTYGTTYYSTVSNLKNDTYDGLTFWLHDYNKRDGGVQTFCRWFSANTGSSGANHNTDWRNALASDIYPSSSFVWVGTDCGTGINLNSQFTGTGSLQLSKTVDNGSTQAFPFKVTLESPSYASGTLSWVPLTGSYAYTVSDAAGTALASGSLQSGDAVELAHGQRLLVSGIPEGTRYTIKETSHVGYQPTQTNATGAVVEDEFVGTIVNGVTSEVDVTNVWMLAPASWSIVKQGDGGEVLEGAEFTIRYYAGDPAGTPTRSWIVRTGANGRASLDAAHLVSGDAFYVDSSGTIGLPMGTVTIEETAAPSGYERDTTLRSYTIQDVGMALECSIPHELAVSNTRITGDLRVSKVLAGVGADPNKSFSFTVSLSLNGEPLSGTFGDLAFTDGVATFALKAGETRNIAGIPAGSGYEVSEAEVPGYAVSWIGRTGTIAAGSTSTAIATNTYSAQGSARLEFTKVYDTDGPELVDGQFTFELHEGSPDGNILATAACSADGKVVFALNYDQSDIGKTFTYFITEVNDAQAGVEYDTHVAKAVVEVANGGNGTLETTISYDRATFTNSYHSYVLPSTGLSGIAGCAGFGVALTGAAAFVLRRRGLLVR